MREVVAGSLDEASRRLRAVVLIGTLATLAAQPALAQHKTTKVGQAGPFIIDRIDENGAFDRCAATLQPGPNMLRISWNKDRVYSMSVPPGPVAKGPLILTIDMGKAGSWSEPAVTNGERAWATLSLATVEKLMAVGNKIVVSLGSKRYEWTIGKTPMTDVFVAMENCVHKAQGR